MEESKDLIAYKEQIPTTVEDLQKFILIGKESLNAQKAKIRAIEKANMALAAKEAALQDTQDIADILLDAEVKLGEMLKRIEPKRDKQGSNQRTSLPSLPPGINKKQSHEAQKLSKNPELVAAVKKEARENGTVATARDVHAKIRSEAINKDIQKDSNNLFQLKVYWQRASKRDRTKFIKWLQIYFKQEVYDENRDKSY
jgi:hypothetical protein